MSLCTLLPLEAVIPVFNVRIVPQVDFLEEAYKLSGKQTKKYILYIQLGKLSWCTAHEEAFRFMTFILNSMKFSYLKKEKVLCLFPDVSDTLWSGVLTKTYQDQL